eukprot:SAG11_NODE_5089_length_1667_cov_1.667730_1_plen_263_part_00
MRPTFETERESGKEGRKRKGDAGHTPPAPYIGDGAVFESEVSRDEQTRMDGIVAAFESEEGHTASVDTPANGARDKIWRTIFMTFDEPETSILAKLIAALIMIMIFASSTAFVIVTMEDIKSDTVLMVYSHVLAGSPLRLNSRTAVLHNAWQEQLLLMEHICIISFTVEYLIRVFTCWARPCERTTMVSPHTVYWRGLTLRRMPAPNPSVFKYIIKPMNLVDLFAIAPFYIELLFKGDVGAAHNRFDQKRVPTASSAPLRMH